MRKPIKTLITGIAAFTLLSIPLYANASNSIKEEVLEFKNVFTKVNGKGKYSRTFEGKDYDYEVYFSASDRLELKVMDKSTYIRYKFVDEESDSTLDFYVGSTGYGFTPETTDAERWKKLQDKYHNFIRQVLPLAKKVLNERSSSLDKDLESME